MYKQIQASTIQKKPQNFFKKFYCLLLIIHHLALLARLKKSSIYKTHNFYKREVYLGIVAKTWTGKDPQEQICQIIQSLQLSEKRHYS
jgi:hypothetical protein